MNMMHASMDITEKTDSKLDEEDIKTRIEQLGQQEGKSYTESNDVFTLF
jgi:hypothetical protein